MTKNIVLKKISVMLSVLLFFSFFPLYSFSGVMWGEKNLKMVATQWFDIIYPQRSERNAKILYGNADGIYEEICASLGTSPQFRMTVTISPSTDTYNAYFTNYPVNHIVLYDKVPEESLAVFSEDIEGTFRHELTHAVTINMRNKFWTALDSVFGDTYNFGCYITMPQLLKEGAAVMEESRFGEGRLNDGFYLHMVRQSIVQKEFPLYTQVTGARDVYPSGMLSYGFGGPFVDWVVKKYGKEKYAEFWYRGINMGAVTYAGLFKKVYGITFEKAWQDFKESVDCPDVCADPEDLGWVLEYQRGQTPGAVFSSMTSSEKGVAYIEKNTSSVWFAPWENGTIGKSRKLFTLRGLNSCRLSKDGRFLTAGVYGINHGNSRNELYVYDLEKGRLSKVPELSLRDACIVYRGDRPLLCAIKTGAGNEAFSIWKINQNPKDGSIISFDFVREYDFGYGHRIFSPVEAKEGKIGFLMKKGSAWSVCLMDLIQEDSPVFYHSDFDEGIALRNLSSACESSVDGKICFNFSYATRETFPRLGTIAFDDKASEISLMDSDISGGVYFPVTGFDGKSCVYIGNFVRENKIFVMDMDSAGFEKKETGIVKENLPWEESLTVGFEDRDFPSKKYVAGFEKGMIIPFSAIPVFGILGQERGGIYFPGISYVCKDPWDGTTLAFMAGVNPGEGMFTLFQDEAFEAAVAAQIAGGSGTSIFNYSFLLQGVFDKNGFAQSALKSEMSSGITFGRTGTFVVSNKGNVIFGNEPGALGDNKYLTFSDSIVLQVGSSKKTGPGIYQKASIVFQLSGDFFLCKDLEDGDMDFGRARKSAVVYPAVIFRIPNLLPIGCGKRFTCNLPAVVCASLGSSASHVLDGYVSVMLFDCEIQNGPTFFPIYFNRFVATATYSFGFQDPEGGINFITAPSRLSDFSSLNFYDAVKLTAVLQCTPNTGAMASPVVMGTIGATLSFYPRGSKNGKLVDVAVTTSLNF